MIRLSLWILIAALQITFLLADETTERRQGRKELRRTMLILCKSDADKKFDEEIRAALKKAEKKDEKVSYDGWKIVVRSSNDESKYPALIFSVDGADLQVLAKPRDENEKTLRSSHIKEAALFDKFFKLSHLKFKDYELSAFDGCKVGVCSADKSRFIPNALFRKRKVGEKAYTLQIISPSGKSKTIQLKSSVAEALKNANAKVEYKNKWTRGSSTFCVAQNCKKGEEKTQLKILAGKVPVAGEKDAVEVYDSFIESLEKLISSHDEKILKK